MAEKKFGNPSSGTSREEVPAAEYGRMKSHLYDRIDRLYHRAVRAETELVKLADIHHRTLTNSNLHLESPLDWTKCPCLTCSGARSALPGEVLEAEAARIRAELDSGSRRDPTDG